MVTALFHLAMLVTTQADISGHDIAACLHIASDIDSRSTSAPLNIEAVIERATAVDSQITHNFDITRAAGFSGIDRDLVGLDGGSTTGRQNGEKRMGCMVIAHDSAIGVVRGVHRQAGFWRWRIERIETGKNASLREIAIGREDGDLFA